MSDEEDSAPLEVQRIVGAGTKRKRIDFVPAGVSTTKSSKLATPFTFTEEKYLSIVLKDKYSKCLSATGTEFPSPAANPSQHQLGAKGAICDICRLPIKASHDASASSTKPHEASIAHQVCLQHSHPPSHLDRTRQGMKYLSSYGWDPDDRLGLGARGDGIRVPIKMKAKNDTVGLGVELQETEKGAEKKVALLDAKRVRMKDLEARGKREKLQEIFHGNSDVDRYLGGV